MTTGAGLWLAGALGVAAGLGQFFIGALAAIFGLLIIAVIGRLERLGKGPAGRNPARFQITAPLLHPKKTPRNKVKAFVH